ncbi:MAG: PaaI family thioesterase [Parvibaculaceae bacterium]
MSESVNAPSAGLTLEEAKERGWPPNIQAAFKRMSPASRYLGLEILDVNMETLTVELAFNASEELCNMWGGIQGGMVAAMLDDAMAFAVGLDLDWGQISPTLEIKVSMLSPARPGRLYATGTVIKRGKSVGFIESELRDADGRVLATGSSTATFVTLKKKD